MQHLVGPNMCVSVCVSVYVHACVCVCVLVCARIKEAFVEKGGQPVTFVSISQQNPSSSGGVNVAPVCLV